MAIKDIKEKIIFDAKIEANKIIDEANNKAKEIKEKGEKEARDIKSKILNKIDQEILLKKGKIITEANLEAKKNILAAKQKIIEETFNKALEKIINLNDKPYCNFIKKIILDNIEKGDETIFISPLDKDRVSKDFIRDINYELEAKGKKGNLKLSPSYLQIRGGVVIGSNNIRKNSSLELIFKKVREELEIKIIQYLFD
ncbi:MAG: V-type ATP synthase subunit E [Candidatus Atribacteria bacterium]